MSKLKVKKIISFKHGVSHFILEGMMKGSGRFEIEFKLDQMNDILKSLFVLDTSEKGYISSISYDAALSTSQLLKSVMLDIPDINSLSSLITQIQGAKVNITIGSAEKITGKIMGMEEIEKLSKELLMKEKLLIIIKNDGLIAKIPFSEISSLDILNEDIKKDLDFFLETIIAGKKKDSKKIIINCESGGDDEIERKIIISYMHDAPVWKTSYRLLMSKQQEKEKKCLLNAWALIENVTNQDWDDVELSLVAGMPVSFIYDFYRPIFIDRPVILPPKALSARPTEIEEGLEREKFEAYAMEEAAAPPMPKMKARDKAGMYEKKADFMLASMPSTTMSGDMDDEIIYNKMSSQTKTQTKDLGELFEYNIENKVTLKRKHSALVPIVTEEIKAKKILLYNKNEHDKNPNVCLEITNNTELTLERGPVTIIYDDNLAGEAIIPFLNKDDTRLLNYAVEQAVIINWEDKTRNFNVHRISLNSGYCYEYFYTNLITIYKLKNKTTEEKELYLDHPKKSGYIIKESPVKPEETPNYWRFKLKLKPKDAISFEITEQLENYNSHYLWNWTRDLYFEKIAFYVQNGFVDKQIEKQLKELAELIGKKNDLNIRKSKLMNERDQMTDEQARLRENLTVLGTTSQESALREKYVKKLNEQEDKFEQITVEIEKIEQEIKPLDKEIQDKMNEINYK